VFACARPVSFLVPLFTLAFYLLAPYSDSSYHTLFGSFSACVEPLVSRFFSHT